MQAQLLVWYKHTVVDPNATLSQAKRGTLSYPCFQSSFKNNKHIFPYQDHSEEPQIIQKGRFMNIIKEKYHNSWPITDANWSYKNVQKAYGTVMLDSIHNADKLSFNLLQQLADYLPKSLVEQQSLLIQIESAISNIQQQTLEFQLSELENYIEMQTSDKDLNDDWKLVVQQEKSQKVEFSDCQHLMKTRRNKSIKYAQYEEELDKEIEFQDQINSQKHIKSSKKFPEEEQGKQGSMKLIGKRIFDELDLPKNQRNTSIQQKKIKEGIYQKEEANPIININNIQTINNNLFSLNDVTLQLLQQQSLQNLMFNVNQLQNPIQLQQIFEQQQEKNKMIQQEISRIMQTPEVFVSLQQKQVENYQTQISNLLKQQTNSQLTYDQQQILVSMLQQQNKQIEKNLQLIQAKVDQEQQKLAEKSSLDIAAQKEEDK